MYVLEMLMSCVIVVLLCFFFFFFKQKTAYEMRISDWSSDVCSSDLLLIPEPAQNRLIRPWRYDRRVEQPKYRSANMDTAFIEQYESAQIGRASCRERVCQYV